MRELCWSLWKQRWAFFAYVVMVAVGAGMIYQVMDGYSLFEMGYRTAFVLLQLIFMLLQRERFRIILRKESAHRFYRSMPNARKKEQKRFVWLDVYCAAMLAVLLTAGIIFKNEFVDGSVPFAMVVYFLVYVPTSRIIACVPYVWWMTELVFAAVFLFVPAFDISPMLCVGTAVAVGVINVLLYRFVRKLWDTED
ncbi:MAG: hypothetical protein IJ427_05845 [Lachnospiraceae bacterium]|nr:hypothetical protein [Lachnospiraceae bacterium]MBQ8548005.1 hypothetical protein [Lachnospiraceae bacterium]